MGITVVVYVVQRKHLPDVEPAANTLPAVRFVSYLTLRLMPQRVLLKTFGRPAAWCASDSILCCIPKTAYTAHRTFHDRLGYRRSRVLPAPV